jgi:hypothetical protein
MWQWGHGAEVQRGCRPEAGDEAAAKDNKEKKACSTSTLKN